MTKNAELPIFLGACCRCGTIQHLDGQLPVCGWCAIKELSADKKERRYRLRQLCEAACWVLATHRHKTVAQRTDLTTHDIRGVKRRLKVQATREYQTGAPTIVLSYPNRRRQIHGTQVKG